MALDEPKENEGTTQVNGIDLLISNEAKLTANMNKIDYIQSPYGEGFIITPKSSISSC